jgi:ribosomal protein L11 methyltransferase
MREVVLRVPRLAAEDVLDRLLLIVPGGVREQPRGRHMELRMRGDDLPTLRELERAAGRWRHKLTEREVSDDWRERRAADYSPDLIGGRLIVRPEWAPTAADFPHLGRDLIEVVLCESPAFGAGTHPTTRRCLELLLDLTPRGSFADLGCGSAVLAIVAAKLGWHPVMAIDVQAASIEAARENAAGNAVDANVRWMDLTVEAAPRADGFAANVPAAVHTSVAAAWAERAPAVGLISGFAAGEAAGVLHTYRAVGLGEVEQVDAGGWTVAMLERG